MAKRFVTAEWDRLRTVAVVSPTHFELTEPINSTQSRFYADAPPSPSALQSEHANITHALSSHGVEVLSIPPTPGHPLQFNVRDAGVVVDGQLVLCHMTHGLRRDEPTLLAHALGATSNAFVLQTRLEGGDVTLTGQDVYVGLSQRTDRDGCRELQSALGDHRPVTQIPLSANTLHLDVALTLIRPDLGIVHRPSIADSLPDSLRGLEWIEVTEEEYSQQAANVLVIDRNTVMLDERQSRLRSELEFRGCHCIPVCITEMTKVGGGIRCMTLPLLRQDAEN